MEVCFVDVAQGTSSVILLGNQQAIVIDCGAAQAETLLGVLRRFQIEKLSRLVISHSHDDHSRGAAAVLTAFQGRIEELWMLDDVRRPESLFWQRVQEELRANRIDRRQIRLLVREDNPKQIYRDDRVLLSLIAPDCVTNFRAVDDRDPNFTSAVLVLKRGKQQIVFAGDSTIAGLTLALASGVCLDEAVAIGNAAGGAVVRKVGVVTASREEIAALFL